MTPLLDARLDGGRLGVDEALLMAGEVCAQLSWAHARGRDTDERDDVRAIGALLATAVAGEASQKGAMRLPRELRAPVLRSLQDKPERRYGTIDELARALGVDRPLPPPPARAPGVAAGLVAALAVGLLGWSPPPRPQVAAPALAAPAAPASLPRRTVAIGRIGGQGWRGEAASEMLATALAERPRLEVVRRGDAALRVEGSLAGDELHLWVAAGDTTLAAERIVLARPLPEEMDGVAARLAARLDAGDGPSLLALSSGSAEAWRAFVEGGEEGWRRAVALDPSFFQPRLRLAERDPGALPAARALVGRAGRRGALALARAEARTPLERVVALEAARAFAPHDLEVAADLAALYRATGRPEACAAEAARAGEAIELAWCRAALGDTEGALEAARSAGDPLFEGDVSLFVGRTGDARRAYREAGDVAGTRLAFLAARDLGRCPRKPLAVASLEDARAAAATWLWCGADGKAAGVEAALRAAGEPLAADLARLRGAARGERGRFAALARDLEGFRGDPVDRGRLLGPLFAAARADGEAAAALRGFDAAPVDRHGLFEAPLLYEVALTQIAAGDLEDAALSCGELDGLLALSCQGRAAEAAGDLGAAFRAYRALLDRLAGADPEHRLARDATRRLRAVVARARASR